jgi:hypothetical protein
MKEFSISHPKHNKSSRHALIYERFDLLRYDQVLRGIERASSSNVFIAGCVRDIHPGILSRNITRIVNLGKKFKSFKFVIYENDSVQEVKNALKSFTEIQLISENLKIPSLGGGRDYQRIYILSQARNKYVEVLKQEEVKPDYVLVVDLDIMDWRADGVFNSLGQNQRWDMIGANGIQVLTDKLLYYDTFALIEKNMKEYATGED